MKAVVIYESMYGNTHLIANAIAEGLRKHGEAIVVPVDEADAALVGTADLLVVGGPTHAHGMSRASTRKGAAEAAEKPGSDLVMDADAVGIGLREWFATIGDLAMQAAAFDTRFDLPAALTGRASKGIARKLHHHRATLVSAPQSFFVTKDNHLDPNEEARARTWGDRLGYDLDGIGIGIGIFPPATPWPADRA
jgi:hypothetical protein